MSENGCYIGPGSLIVGFSIKQYFLQKVEKNYLKDVTLGMKRYEFAATFPPSNCAQKSYRLFCFQCANCQILSMSSSGLVLEEAAFQAASDFIVVAPSSLKITQMFWYTTRKAEQAGVKAGLLDNFSNTYFNDKKQTSRCHILHLLPWANHLNLLNPSSSSVK